MPAEIRCAVPGCDRGLAERNVSGTCRDHNHAVGYCRCAECLRKTGQDTVAAPPLQTRPDHPDRKRVMVPYLAQNPDAYARITLPRAPWEGGGHD